MQFPLYVLHAAGDLWRRLPLPAVFGTPVVRTDGQARESVRAARGRENPHHGRRAAPAAWTRIPDRATRETDHTRRQTAGARADDKWLPACRKGAFVARRRPRSRDGKPRRRG